MMLSPIAQPASEIGSSRSAARFAIVPKCRLSINPYTAHPLDPATTKWNSHLDDRPGTESAPDGKPRPAIQSPSVGDRWIAWSQTLLAMMLAQPLRRPF